VPALVRRDRRSESTRRRRVIRNQTPPRVLEHRAWVATDWDFQEAAVSGRYSGEGLDEGLAGQAGQEWRRRRCAPDRGVFCLA
jgi:hypothetical protein